MNKQIPSSLQTISRVCLILFALNFFFLSISLLGSFKDLGAGYGQTLLVELANSPFFGLLIGLLITSIAQSSSVTTSSPLTPIPKRYGYNQHSGAVHSRGSVYQPMHSRQWFRIAALGVGMSPGFRLLRYTCLSLPIFLTSSRF